MVNAGEYLSIWLSIFYEPGFLSEMLDQFWRIPLLFTRVFTILLLANIDHYYSNYTKMFLVLKCQM